MQKAVGRKQKAVGHRQYTVGSRQSGETRLVQVGLLPAAVRRLLTAFCILLTAFCLLPAAAPAQTPVDKMVATVNGGVGPQLITYSDLLWQLALQPSSS